MLSLRNRRLFFLTVAVFVIFPLAAISQKCDCGRNFQWIANTIETNDAGFSYVISKKTDNTYRAFKEKTNKEAAKVSDYFECLNLLNSYLRFFRKAHLGISFTDSVYRIADSVNLIKIKSMKPASAEVMAKHERFAVDEASFRKYLDTLSNLTYEGIWETSPSYRIAIKKVGDTYVGSILEAPGTPWKKDQVKIKVYPTYEGYKGMYADLLFRKTENMRVDTSNWGNGYLHIGGYVWTRKYPANPDSLFVKEYWNSTAAEGPYLEKVSDRICYLRVPGFAISQKEKIDSVLQKNHNLITGSSHLVIDVRGNGGGADDSYTGILKYLYTNTIMEVGAAIYSTPLNNQSVLRLSNDAYFPTESRKRFAEEYQVLNRNPGKFIVRGETLMRFSYDTIYPQPDRVSILIDESCASSTEQFLLAARQSSKVKLIGRPTMGSLDMSNMNTVESPSKEFQLSYATSRSLRIPDLPVDETGIQPDIFMPRTIPKSKWKAYVIEGNK